MTDNFEGAGRLPSPGVSRPDGAPHPTDPLAPGDALKHNPIELAIEFAQNGEMYQALTTWYSSPSEERSNALGGAILEANKLGRSYFNLRRNKDLPPKLQFMLDNFALLSSPKIEHILHEKEEITDFDVNRLDEGGTRSIEERFRQIGEQAGIDTRRGNLCADMDDFDTAKSIIINKFSSTDIRQMVLDLGPRAKATMQKQSGELWPFPWGDNIVNPVTQSDLLLDPEVAKYLEYTLTKHFSEPQRFLYAYLANLHYPAPAFFEKFFAVHTEIANPNSIVKTEVGELPTSLYFYTMLRRITHIDGAKRIPDNQIAYVRENVVKYLFSDEIMQRVLPYLQNEEVYGVKMSNGDIDDQFIDMSLGAYDERLSVVESGITAREIKIQKFGEVISAAIDWLEQNGRQEEVVQLRSREVGGIKFADFLKTPQEPAA